MAGCGLLKLTVLDEWNACRRKVADQYSTLLANVDIILPAVPEYAEPVWHLYVIRCKQRDVLKIHLEHQGVSTAIHYPIPPHKQTCYSEFSKLNLPIAETLAKEVLSIPISSAITEEEIVAVVDAVHVFNG